MLSQGLSQGNGRVYGAYLVRLESLCHLAVLCPLFRDNQLETLAGSQINIQKPFETISASFR
jgi:hypothetical protein